MPPPANYQQEVGMVRPPRVQITYDVEENGVKAQRQLPFVVGIIAGLSGDRPEKELGPLAKRQFKDIDRDNINDRMRDDYKPQLTMHVPDRVTDKGGDMVVRLKFDKMADFDPHSVIEQVPALKALMDARKQLDTLLAKINVNDDLAGLMAQVLKNTETRQAIAAEVGAAGEGK